MFTVISCSGSSQPVTATPSNADLARSQRLKGIALMCAALAIFSVLDASAKWISQHMHPMQAVWARYAVSVLLVMVLINPWTRPGVMRSSAPVLQGIRSLMLLLSTVFNFLALQYLQLAEAIAIIFATMRALVR